MIGNPLLLGDEGGYQISRSVRLRSSASAYLNRTPAGAGNRQIFTISAWLKRGSLGVADSGLFTAWDGTNRFYSRFEADDKFYIYVFVGGSAYEIATSMVFRDPSAWYHIVLAVDTTQATNTNRMKIYVNGVQQTFTGTYAPQNTSTQWNNTVQQNIGKKDTSGSYFDGYMTEINSVDGQTLTPSSFGETNAITGVWQPKKYAGTYGTNGFYLNFSDNSGATATTIGKDYSGNGNNWTPNNISVTAGATYDSMVDSPTVGATSSNYNTLNPAIRPYTITPAEIISNGNLTLTCSSASVGGSTWGTVPISSGKWYAECTLTTAGTGTGVDQIGVSSNMDFAGRGTFAAAMRDYGYTYRSNGNACNNSATGSAYGASFTSGDVIGIAFDADAGSITFYKNNASQGVAFTSMTSSGGFLFGSIGFNGSVHNWNFGQRPFSYTPPTGFVALNTQNLSAPTISNGANYFNAITSTATVSTGTTLSSLAFSPGLLWRKNRDNVESHYLVDAVRGTGAGGFLSSETTAAAAGYPNSDGTFTFNSNGYTIAETNWNAGEFYFNGRTYIDWIWNAGDTTVTNTSGTISAQVRANPTAGFSVVTYTANNTAGATIGHGLGVAPSFIIVKSRSAVNSWNCYHTSLGNTKGIDLNGTGAASTNSLYWNNTSPTSSVFSVSTFTNNSTSTYVAYCFAAVAGYSAFGNYTGNGSTDGPFVYTGFRPRFVLFKKSSAADDWIIYDTSRDTYNVASKNLYPNGSFAEDTNTTNRAADILSNGFKIRSSATFLNLNAATFIYAAFAENPFKHSLAR